MSNDDQNDELLAFVRAKVWNHVDNSKNPIEFPLAAISV